MKTSTAYLLVSSLLFAAPAKAASNYETCIAPLNISESDIQRPDFDSYADRLAAQQEQACAQVEQAIDSYNRISTDLLSPSMVEYRATAEKRVAGMKNQIDSLAGEITNTRAEITSEYADKFKVWSGRADIFSKEVQAYQTALLNLKPRTDPLIDSLQSLIRFGNFPPGMDSDVAQTISDAKILSTPSNEVGNLVSELSALLAIRRRTFNQQVQTEINSYIAGASKSLFSNLATQRFLLEADQMWGSTKVGYAVLRFQNYGLYRTALNYVQTTESMILNAQKSVTLQSKPQLVAQLEQSLAKISQLKNQLKGQIDAGGAVKTKAIERSLRNEVPKVCNTADPGLQKTLQEIDRIAADGEQLEALAKKNPPLVEIADTNTEMIVSQLRMLNEICKTKSGAPK